MFIIWGNDNLSKISGKLERVTLPLPENWHGMACLQIFKFETLFDHLLWCDSNGQGKCSRLSRNI